MAAFTGNKIVEHAGTGGFKNYSFEQISLRMRLPQTTVVTKEYITSQEILFSSYLNDKKLGFWGFVQLWNISNVDSFLNRSKSQSEFNFINYENRKIQNKYDKGFRLTWSAKLRDARVLLGTEYFLPAPHDDRVLRISFFADNNFGRKKLNRFAEQAIASLEWQLGQDNPVIYQP